jgi:hypothetical protein
MAGNRMLRWIFGLGLAALLMVGCGKKPPPAFSTWAKPAAPYVPVPSSGNAFDAYAIAATQVEATAGKYLDRVFFYPGHKRLAAEMIKGPFQSVVSAASLPCKFKFVSSAPFSKPRYGAGWRLIGRVFAWKTADAMEAGDYKNGVRMAVTGTRFGLDLTGGGAMDASLGLSIVDDIRKAMLPYLDKIPPAELLVLSSGLRSALSRQASPEVTIQNERENMLAGVQAVQDAFSSNKLDDLQKELGPTVKEAVDYLKGLQDEKLEERQGYFSGFAAEASAYADAFQKAAAQPAAKRPTEIKPRFVEERPWRRFSPHFFGTLQPLLEMHDATTARTRLLAITASLMSQKERDSLPPLSAYPAAIITDPYSGHPFIFRSDGPEFVLYSIGPNRKDDGGDTDTTFTNPDLTLELGP